MNENMMEIQFMEYIIFHKEYFFPFENMRIPKVIYVGDLRFAIEL